MTNKVLVLAVLLLPSLALADPFLSGDFGVKPALQFHFDDCGGAAVYSWSRPLKGTIGGTPACVQGMNGKALRFFNTNDNVTGSDSNLVSGTNPWTLAFWVKFDKSQTPSTLFFFGTDAPKSSWSIGFSGPQMNIDPNGGSHTFNVTPSNKTDSYSFVYIQWGGGSPGLMEVTLMRPNGIKMYDSFSYTLPAIIVLSGTFFIGNNQVGTGPCMCTIDDLQFFDGKDNFGEVWSSFWRGKSKGY